MTRCLAGACLSALAACAGEAEVGPEHGDAVDPAVATVVEVDRFSDDAGTMLRRSTDPSLPGPGAPIDVDALFAVGGLGPGGEAIVYYSFDVQPLEPMLAYRLVDAAGVPIPGQLLLVTAAPGEPAYNDFWKVEDVTVPSGYVANSITSVDELLAAGYETAPTLTLLNRPVVPPGSIATQRWGGAEAATEQAWLDDAVVHALAFDEAEVQAKGGGTIPYAAIYVCLRPNPGPDGPQPGSVFCEDPATGSTRNVVDTLPADATYSPLWNVKAYDEAAFDDVGDLATAMAAPQLASLGMVNCPLVAGP